MNNNNILDAYVQFYLDNPQKCLKILQNLQTKDSNILKKKDILMYRSYIALHNYRVPLDEISQLNSSAELKSVRILAKYFSDFGSRQNALKEIEEILNGNLDVENDTTLIVAGIMYLHEMRPEQALKVLHNGDSLECQALTIQALLEMHRVDLAKKELKKMLDTNEDDVLSQLSLAMVNLSVGGDKLRDAFNIYQELDEKYQSHTNMIRNGQTVALIGLGKPEEAEPILQDAMDKNPNDPDTLINMIVLSQMLGKPFEVTNRYITQLKDSNANHPYVKDYIKKEAEFDSLMNNYGVGLSI